MNMNNLTIKTQEVLQGAVDKARSLSQQAIDPAHILAALIDKGAM